MTDPRIVVIGAGIGGLACAIELAAKGFDVRVVERASAPGGKMHTVDADGLPIDAGPTVLTMRWVFDSLFDHAGTRLERHVTLEPLSILARHAWQGTDYFDLYADPQQASDAVAAFAGAQAAEDLAGFKKEAAAIYDVLKSTFLTAPKPNPVQLSLRVGLHRIDRLLRIRPFDTLWSALSRHFSDDRLRQLFGRYATYCGASPFLAPATLMLIAMVEMDGVWSVKGGMQNLARALADVLRMQGGTIGYGRHVEDVVVRSGRTHGVRLNGGERIEADAVVFNGDAAALATGLLGKDAAAGVTSHVPVPARSLSAITWAMSAKVSGFPLVRHNVFFGGDYRSEFEHIFKLGRLPEDPTVYVCAQDRLSDPLADNSQTERLLVLVNAPALADCQPLSNDEIDQCEKQVLEKLDSLGLNLQILDQQRSTPATFHRRFPGSGGALYGRASHGWRATFQRPRETTRIRGLYLAGGSVHPGPGVPMAALSGQIAAQRLTADLALTHSSHRAVTFGGMSTRSVKTAAMD